MTFMMRIEVYSARPAGKTVEPARILVRESEWARRLIERFNRFQGRREQARRAYAVGRLC